MVLLVVNSALGRNALSAEPPHTWLQVTFLAKSRLTTLVAW